MSWTNDLEQLNDLKETHKHWVAQQPPDSVNPTFELWLANRVTTAESQNSILQTCVRTLLPSASKDLREIIEKLLSLLKVEVSK